MKQTGFSLVELLIVIAILGILIALITAGLALSRQKAFDAKIKTAINQVRSQAEIAFSGNGESFYEWTTYSGVQDELQLLQEGIDEAYGDAAGEPYVTILRDTQDTDYCASAPSRASLGTYYCVDATGVLQTTTAECPDYIEDGDPLRCPS